MLFTFNLLLSLSFLVSARPGTNEFCFDACQQILGYVLFNSTNPETGQRCLGKQCVCSNQLGLSSLYLCNRLYCSPEERKQGLFGLKQTCQTLNTTLPPYSIIEHYTDLDIEKLRHLQREDASWPIRHIFNETVIPSQKLFTLALDTLDAAHYETRIHMLYGFTMYYYWVAVVLVGLSSHMMRYLARKYQDSNWQQLPESDSTVYESTIVNGKGTISSSLYTLLKRYVTVPASFGYTRSQNIGWCTVPTRVQSITIAIFVALNIVLCSISYRVFEDNLYWPEISTQVWRYVADRTGVISTANLAVIWAFGIRNNTLLWLTGWDFATYNNFHRWVARVATVEAVVHSIAYTVLIFMGKSFSQGWALYVNYYYMKFFVAGVMATFFMCAICGFSVYGLRRNFYEIFLWLHIILSVLVIVTMWYHVEIFNGEYNGYIWPCITIWVFDRILRLLRIISFNLKFWNTKALATYDSDSNIVRLVVPYSRAIVEPRPGTFYYVTVLNDFRIWESHPFTLAYSTSEQDVPSLSSSMGTITPPQHGMSPRTPDEEFVFRNRPFESENLLKVGTSAAPLSLVFIIRPYNGFTARLRDFALPGPKSLRVLIDGPYGETQPLHKYDNVLFIVGGTGIAVPLSYLNLLLGDESSTSSLRVVWAVREHDFLTVAIETDFKDALDNEKMSLTAYVTRAEEAHEDDFSRILPRGLQVHRGRPNVYSEVEEAARDSGSRSLAVVACGPGQMADDARSAVVRMLKRGWGKIEYFEESFNW